jgi:FtsH-binding integral membrane protein
MKGERMFYNNYPMDRQISSFMAGVYGWMSSALMVTAGAAYYVAITPAIVHFFFTSPMAVLGLFLGQMAIVFGIVAFLPRMNFATALGLFFLYALSVGITTSSLFFVFELGSIISTFLTTAVTFGLMSLYGYVTKTDLTTVGNIALMVLMGLVVAIFINIFLKSSRFEYATSFIGVVVFVLLTAYDTQKIKQIGLSVRDEEMRGKMTVVGALTLYLDFINLFMFLLRFMGKRRED